MYGCDCNTVYGIGDAELLRQIAERASRCPQHNPTTGDDDMDKWIHRRMEKYEEELEEIRKTLRSHYREIQEVKEEQELDWAHPIERRGETVFVDCRGVKDNSTSPDNFKGVKCGNGKDM